MVAMIISRLRKSLSGITSAWDRCAERTEIASNLALDWRILTYAPGKAAGRFVTRAAFRLRNVGETAVSSEGWWIYFNCLSGARPVPGDVKVVVEPVAGSLFRLRPANPDSGTIPAGGFLELVIEHPDAPMRTDKGPIGPYIVFDTTPGVGRSFPEYTSFPAPRSARLDGLPDNISSLEAPEDLFVRNQLIETDEFDLDGGILPSPVMNRPGSGFVRLDRSTTVIAPRKLRSEARLAREILAGFAPTDAGRSGATLQLSIGRIAGFASHEAYRLTLNPAEGATLVGASDAGVFYGLQTLRQLGPNPPAQTITDAPRFAYRGLLIDVARNFRSKAEVLGVLEAMARFKLNTLHLHFADDEGWRLEIPGLPDLTEIGARRGHTVDETDRLPPAYGSGPDLGNPNGTGFYSERDYIEILKFARARHIEVIPEVEMPGHARAAVRAMARREARLSRRGAKSASAYRLRDPADTSEYRSAQLYSDNVIDPGLPSTYAFVDKVVSDIARMHRRAGAPLRILHVGADELAPGAWEKSPAVQTEMARLKLGGTADLWDHFYDRIAAIAHGHGAHLAGWEELGVRKMAVRGRYNPGPNPHFHGRGFLLYAWNNLPGSEDLAYRLANSGYPVVLTPATHLYFDMAHSRDALEPGHNWAAYTDLFDVFGFDPFDITRGSRSQNLQALTPRGRSNIAGLEGTLFSETITSAERLGYMLAPRLIALAERAWAPAPSWALTSDPAAAQAAKLADWSRFSQLVGRKRLPELDRDLPGLTYRIPPPGLIVQEGAVQANHAYPGFTLRYTIDGTAPTLESPEVSGPIAARGSIAVAAFNTLGRSGRASIIDNP